VQGVAGYTLTPADIAKFRLGDFLSSAAAPGFRQEIISATHTGALNGFMLNNLGQLVAR
jgi:hypothetical protein